jgi:hypothetical protein
MAIYSGPGMVTDGLVLCLDGGDTLSYPGTGTTWYDLSGNGNNGILRNWTAPGTTTVSNVKCFYLNGPTFGTGDIEISNFYTNFVAGDNTHTFQWWGYANSTSNIDPFNSGACGTPCIAYGESGSYFDAQGAKPISVGLIVSEWHQYTLVQNGTTATSYRDGVQIATRNDWGTPEAASRPGIIGSRSWSDRQNNWYLSTYKWYNKALTPAEIAQNFEAFRGRFGI